MARDCRWERRTAKRERAAARTAARAQRSDKEQLALIATRRGESRRETRRLLLNLAVERSQQPKTEAEIIEGGVAFITKTDFGGE